LLTSVLDETQLMIQPIEKYNHMRWSIEVAFRALKRSLARTFDALHWALNHRCEYGDKKQPVANPGAGISSGVQQSHR
jgi:hypothetical protein